jgi:alpha-amylase
MLHAFGWSYGTVERRAAAIAAAGYRAVLVAPPLKTDRRGGCPWWAAYQPQDWRVIDNCAGNRQSFVRMLRALGRQRVRVVADVVVNHMANERGGATDFPGPAVLADYRSQPGYWRAQRLYGDLRHGLFGSRDFHPRFCIGDYGDPGQVLRGRICGDGSDPGLPDLLDTAAGPSWVNEQRRAYLQALHDLGVRGFRIDAAKHMPPAAIRAFVPDTVARHSHVFAETITGGGSSDRDFQLYLKPYLEQLPASFGAYDFPLLNAMRRALAPGGRLSDLADPYSSGNALEPRRAVTVAVTHDIPTNAPFRSLIFDRTDERLAYAYILGRDGGTPLVFDDGSRESSDGGRWAGVWADPAMKRMIAFHNRMHGQPMEVLFADACTLLWRRGEEGVGAINKCAEEKTISLDTRRRFRWFRTYRDSLDPTQTWRIDGERLSFQLPPRRAHLWMVE